MLLFSEVTFTLLSECTLLLSSVSECTLLRECTLLVGRFTLLVCQLRPDAFCETLRHYGKRLPLLHGISPVRDKRSVGHCSHSFFFFVDVLRVCQVAILQGVTATPTTFSVMLRSTTRFRLPALSRSSEAQRRRAVAMTPC